jgi:hypothetical protein
MGNSRLRNKNETDLELEAISSTKSWSLKPGLVLVLAKEKFTRLISRLQLKIISVIYFKTRCLDRSRSNGRLIWSSICSIFLIIEYSKEYG